MYILTEAEFGTPVGLYSSRQALVDAVTDYTDERPTFDPDVVTSDELQDWLGSLDFSYVSYTVDAPIM